MDASLSGSLSSLFGGYNSAILGLLPFVLGIAGALVAVRFSIRFVMWLFRLLSTPTPVQTGTTDVIYGTPVVPTPTPTASADPLVDPFSTPMAGIDPPKAPHIGVGAAGGGFNRGFKLFEYYKSQGYDKIQAAKKAGITLYNT